MKAEPWVGLFSQSLRARNYAEATVTSYSQELRQFCRFLEQRDLTEPSEIRQEDVAEYQLFLHQFRKPDGELLKPSTRCSKLGAVLHFFRFLHEEGFLLADPGRQVKRPRLPDPLPPELPDEEQVLRLLEQPDTSCPRGLRDRAILELLYGSGLRNTELRNLTVEEVDLHRLEVTVRCGKGGRGRKTPLSEMAGVWVESYLREARPLLLRTPSCEWLFLNQWGRPLKREALCDLVRSHAEAAKLGVRVTPHRLRHACATHMLARGAGLRHLQTLLGHANVSTTQRYTRVEVSDLREVMERCHPRESC